MTGDAGWTNKEEERSAPFARLLLAAGNDGRAFEVIVVVAVQLVVIFAIVQVVIFVKVIELASTGPLLELDA